LIEAGESVEGIAQYQHAPTLTNPLQTSQNRALQIADAFVLHAQSVVAFIMKVI
jgi:hypothetical protein